MWAPVQDGIRENEATHRIGKETFDKEPTNDLMLVSWPKTLDCQIYTSSLAERME